MVKDNESRASTSDGYVAILRKTSSNEGDCNKKTYRGITTIRPIRPNSRSKCRQSSEQYQNYRLKVNEDHSMEPNINFNVAGSPISRHPRSPPENLSLDSEVDDSDTNLSSTQLVIRSSTDSSLLNLSENSLIQDGGSADQMRLSNVVITVKDSKEKSSSEDLEISSKGNESDTNDEFSTQEYCSTLQLLDPDVTADCLSSSQSTPETLPQVVDERAAGEAALEQQRKHKGVDVKRSSSFTSSPTAGATDVLAGSAPPNNNSSGLRRMLGERPGFTELGLGMCDLAKAHSLRRRCHLFADDDEQKVSASKSLNGEWLLSDHPNPTISALHLHAQESAFPTFYDKIERPVPLPPWDDPSFALEERSAAAAGAAPTTAPSLPSIKRRLKSVRF